MVVILMMHAAGMSLMEEYLSPAWYAALCESTRYRRILSKEFRLMTPHYSSFRPDEPSLSKVVVKSATSNGVRVVD